MSVRPSVRLSHLSTDGIVSRDRRFRDVILYRVYTVASRAFSENGVALCLGVRSGRAAGGMGDAAEAAEAAAAGMKEDVPVCERHRTSTRR